MKSREIVRRAVHFEKPPRLPVIFPCFDCSDVTVLWPVPEGTFASQTQGTDLWGCEWEHTALQNIGQIKGHPLADPLDLEKLQTPRYDDDHYYSHLPGELAAAESQGKYVLAGLFMVLFERMHGLHGFKNVLLNLVADPPAMAALADRILDVQLTLVDNMRRRFGSRVQGFHMTDDWGTQMSAFISTDLWMDFFLPRYKKLFDAMHAGGYDVWLHSCGKINAIIEGFIQAGVNVVNLQQPRALGIADIGQQYRGRIAFESLCDIQHTLPAGDADAIKGDVADLMAHWASPEGGFIFSDYGDDEAIGVKDPRVKLTMYEQFSEYSRQIYGEKLPEPRLP